MDHITSESNKDNSTDTFESVSINEQPLYDGNFFNELNELLALKKLKPTKIIEID